MLKCRMDCRVKPGSDAQGFDSVRVNRLADHLHKFAADTPTCTMRGLSTPATPTNLKILLSISRLRAFWITTFLAPVISGQNADACGCLAGSELNVKSIPVLVR
jgi:hypothetical protein